MLELSVKPDLQPSAKELDHAADLFLGDNQASGRPKKHLRVQLGRNRVQGCVQYVGRAVEGDDIVVFGLGEKLGYLGSTDRHEGPAHLDEEAFAPR